MLRVSEKWQGSDVGRQRSGNEDNFFVQSPLFVLADGMGGAQAGEVASEIAIEAFREAMPADQDALVATIETANGRVHEQANSVPEYHGMGTTCTVAYVGEEEVVVAHVGDSRCYLLRDGELTRITKDHSLVGELVARGRVTEEEALIHPQRSVITRAVGPEATVKVDADRIAARPGDLFLLCSDGLTDMVRDRDVARILKAVPSLEQVGRNLIAAANAAGGRDNITVILFRLEEVPDGAAVPEPEPDTQATTITDAVDEPAPRPGGSAPPPRTAPLPKRDTPAPAPKSRARRLVKPLIVIVILLGLFGTAGFVAMRGVFFVGLDSSRTVTIYRGLPYDGPAGIKLYTRNYTSGVRIDQVPEERRDTFTAHKLRSLDDATDLVQQLERGTVK
ncbi:MAG: family protein phosphatase [Solirubrobacteraceae bacterium]|jgi:protein phosphatase|nr:family protein phosphatase [Solirubrobacteraceae bacterium]